jgi:hypothetical protein
MYTLPGLVLNGSRPKDRELRQFITAVSDSAHLRASGGYLFKTCLHENALFISICPAISEGERHHHYDIQVPDTDHVLGTISSIGEITMLFKARKEELDSAERKKWRDIYTAFASVLIASGYNGTGRLDWITQQIIRESEIFGRIPATLSEMAGMQGQRPSSRTL